MKTHRRAFIKQIGFGAAGLGLFSALPGCMSSRRMGYRGLPRSTPEEQGVSSEAILGFLDGIAASKHEFHSFMMVRRGHVIAEGWWSPYRTNANHMLYSLSKSFTSTAVGFAVTEGLLKVDDHVVSFFPDKLPAEKSEHLEALQVKHLLMMSVGRAKDSMPVITKEMDWVRTFLAAPIEHPPGSVFLYDSGATYMLSAIVQKVSGQRVIDYLRPRLFEPLEIEGMTWETSPQGINTGGWGLAVRTEALAKFGQLYLQEGMWKGRQIIPASWIHEATTFKIQQPAGPNQDLEKLKTTSDWHQGYCYQFWRCRHNGFRGDGAFGQFMIILPEKETVIAITSQTADMQGELNLVWEHLLPGIKDTAVDANAQVDGRLSQRLAMLELPPAKGAITSPIVEKGRWKKFEMSPNELGIAYIHFYWSVANEKEMVSRFAVTTDKGGSFIDCGMGSWRDGICNVPGTPPHITVGELLPCKVAASAAWKDDNTFEMIWRYYETPHHDVVTCHFDGKNITVEFKNAIPNHKETRPILHGQKWVDFP